jgi:hypothetical protein
MFHEDVIPMTRTLGHAFQKTAILKQLGSGFDIQQALLFYLTLGFLA